MNRLQWTLGLVALALAGCPGDPPTDGMTDTTEPTDTTDTTDSGDPPTDDTDTTDTAVPPPFSVNVDAPAGAEIPGNVLLDFDDATQATGWTGTGVFESPATADAWVGTAASTDSAYVGLQAMSTCEIGGLNCDEGLGDLTYGPFTPTQDYVAMLLTGGGEGANVGVEVIEVLESSERSMGIYRPEQCAPSFVDGNDDWVQIDLSEVQDRSLKLRIFDDSDGSCGFVAADHVFTTDTAFPFATPANEDAGTIVFTAWPVQNVTLLPGALDEVIGDFDDAQQTIADGWVGTGAFENPGAPEAWVGTTLDPSGAFVGERSVSTCEIGGGNCDGPRGTLTSPDFVVAGDYLNFLMAGGGTLNEVGVDIIEVDGATETVIARHNPGTCGPSFINGNDDWSYIDVSDYVGQTIKIRIYDEFEGGCGFISFDHLYQSDAARGVEVAFATDQATNVGVTSDAFADVLLDFEDAVAIDSTWETTGIFANPVAADSWYGGVIVREYANVARVGVGLTSTCELGGNCDDPTGTLTSPAFTVAAGQEKLSFLMAGGLNEGGTPVGVEILRASDDTVLANYSPNKCAVFVNGNADWHHIDLTNLVGEEIKVRVYDRASGVPCGFFSADHFYFSSTGRGNEVASASLP